MQNLTRQVAEVLIDTEDRRVEADERRLGIALEAVEEKARERETAMTALLRELVRSNQRANEQAEEAAQRSEEAERRREERADKRDPLGCSSQAPAATPQHIAISGLPAEDKTNIDKLRETLLSTAYDTTKYASKTFWLMPKKAGDTVRATAAKIHRMCKRFAHTESVENTLEKVSMEKLLQLFPAEVQAHCRDKESTGLYEMADLIAKFMALQEVEETVRFRQALDLQAQSRESISEASLEWTSLREESRDTRKSHGRYRRKIHHWWKCRGSHQDRSYSHGEADVTVQWKSPRQHP